MKKYDYYDGNVTNTKTNTETNDETVDETADDTADDDSDQPNPLLLELADNPDLDDALIHRLTFDIATGLHSPLAIARRYNLETVERLREYLLTHPAVVMEAKKLKALFMSDASAEERVRMKFIKATEHLIQPLAWIAENPKVPLTARIDAFKQIQRGAGLDGMGARALAAGGKADGSHPFQLVIRFDSAPPVTIDATDIHTKADEITTVVPELPAPVDDPPEEDL